MNKIRQKLTSQSGASITYALLLFLVCAVVSSVVLAAGTAASGRMSKAKEGDERYYSVSSAAEYLKKLIDGKSVVVKTSGGSTSYKGTQGNVILENISLDAVAINNGGSADERNCTLTAGEDDSVAVSAEYEPYPDGDSKLIIKIYNPDGEVGSLFQITLTFTASVGRRKTKNGTTSQKVVWSYYSISTAETSSTVDDTP